MAKKKKAKKGRKAVPMKPAPIPSVYETQLNELKAMLTVIKTDSEVRIQNLILKAVESRRDYICLKIYVSTWKLASVKLLMRTCDTFESVKRQLEEKYGISKNFVLYKDLGEPVPTPGEEITDMDQSLEKAGYKGSMLNDEHKIVRPEYATSQAILHCEFDPTVKDSILDHENLIVIDGKLQSSLAVRAKEQREARKTAKKKSR